MCFQNSSFYFTYRKFLKVSSTIFVVLALAKEFNRSYIRLNWLNKTNTFSRRRVGWCETCVSLHPIVHDVYLEGCVPWNVDRNWLSLIMWVMEIELKSSALAVAASAITSWAIWSKMCVSKCIIRTSEVAQLIKVLSIWHTAPTCWAERANTCKPSSDMEVPTQYIWCKTYLRLIF